MPTKKALLLALAGLALIVGVIYLGFFQGKLKVAYPVPRAMINKFSSQFYENLSLKYPKTYSVQDYSPAFKVLTVSKTADSAVGKIEIFRAADVGPRGETASAKEQFTLGDKDNSYTVLMYYPDNDAQTQSELHQIYNSLKIE